MLDEVVDDFLDRLAGGSHRHDHLLGGGIADVVEELVVSAGQVTDFLHVVRDDAGELEIVGIGGFPALEIDVRILGGASQFRTFRIGAARPKPRHRLSVDQAGHVLVVDQFDLLDFVRRAESVKEVQKGNAGLDGRQVGHQPEVHDLLHRCRGQQGKAGLADRHDVLVIAEDGQGVGGDGPRGHVHDTRQQLAGHLVHVGNHQQQSLRGREGGGQRTGRQAAVDGRRGPGFRLHLPHRHALTENVLTAGGGPLIGDLTDRRGGGYRIDRCHIAHGIRHVRRGGVAVDRFHLLCHKGSPLCLSIFYK